MLHGRDKEQSRRNRGRIRDLLMREWDPIGIKDEYDGYVGKVYVMLMYENASADAIARLFGRHPIKLHGAGAR